MTNIDIIGAKQNNLKNINVSIPKHQLTVFTGRSGSGKSSLVFNTVAAESERLLNETYSSYVQHQLTQYKKPDVDQIKHLPVAMIINQKRLGGNSRSTVGTISDISRNNLKNISTELLKHAMTVVTGVAGSGKSSLITTAFEQNEDAIFINQKPVHASNRSNLLTYLDIFDDVRSFFSKHTGLKKSMFSYNSEGACPECHGKGVLKTELAFMPDFSQVCEMCGGTRYRPEVLDAKVDGYSIADILDLTVDEAIEKFEGHTNITRPLQALSNTGLNYMTLGQSLDTLSGGETQRVKLSRYLTEDVTEKIFIFDEPTTGLHEDDLPILIECFNHLIDEGNTVILIEHNLTMMTEADWFIDIGPFAGEHGGQLLYAGDPKGLLNINNSVTAKHLRRYIE